MRTDDEIVFFQKKIKESLDYIEEILFSFKYEHVANKGTPLPKSIFFEKLEILSRDEEGYQHNCLPCNLTDGLKLIQYFLKNNLNCENIKFFVNMYSILLYQQAERYGVVYSQIGYKTINNEFDWNSFPNLQKIKYWANFFKHPKSSLFLHHPTFHIESYSDNPNFMFDGYINSVFVKKYFSGSKLNLELERLLLNKNYKIFFPDLVDFTKLICDESKSLIEIINSDKCNIESLKLYRKNTL